MRLFLILLSILAVLALAAGGAAWAGWVWLQAEFSREGPADAETVVMLPRGSGLIRIAETLEAEGVVRDARLFRALVMIERADRDLRAGEYAIPSGASLQDIYRLLRSGRTLQYPITIPEGRTSTMVVRILEASEILTGEIDSIPPEGTLLPETYLVDRGANRQELLNRMRADQEALLDVLWPNRAENLPFSTREEAIILASIVEKETGIAEERPRVAAVFVNRLRRGMALASDPTIIYGITGGEPLGRGIRRSELDNRDNLYNTYHHPGLTPTAIANPGRDAIAAVLNPPESNELFFVADGTGGHAFAATYAEHLRNVARWREIERRQRAGGR